MFEWCQLSILRVTSINSSIGLGPLQTNYNDPVDGGDAQVRLLLLESSELSVFLIISNSEAKYWIATHPSHCQQLPSDLLAQ
jgi:hypothetical protein